MVFGALVLSRGWSEGGGALPFCSQLLAQTIGNGASGAAFDVLALQVVQQTAVLAANILSFRARM